MLLGRIQNKPKESTTMSNQITTAFVNQFKSGIELQFQQAGSRLRPFVTNESQNSEYAYYDRIGSVSASEVTTRHGDTVYTETPHSRRRCQLKRFDVADLIDDADRLQMLTDPTSSYVQNFAFALGRKIDEEIISAAKGTAYTGKTGATAVTFPGGQTVAVNYVETGSTANSNLTWAKLRKAKFLLESAEAINPGEPLILAYTANQKQSLLRLAESANVAGYTMSRIERGEVGDLMGLTLVQTELLSKSGNNRSVLVFPRSAITLAVAKDITVNVDTLPGKRYSVQAYAAMQVGAVRMWEEKVVEILADETVG